ncbi:histidine kinase dimerization/phospho-acceptor domain-containing protein [Sphingomicrobium sp. XHP0235]|uniref:sensor histidine kinase n=1 Tax=Sphingomicrobium aquimarinum TaxID=3133971 RepID=UPI0031FF19C1
MERHARVRFDDRLATLLTLPVTGARDRAVRWRQLVELAARVSEQGVDDSAPMVAALAVIRSERDKVPTQVRSATARAIAGRALGLDMLQLFAEDDLAVAAPVLAAAPADDAMRARLLDAARGRVRSFLADLWPEVVAEAQDENGEADPETRRLSEVMERLKAAREAAAAVPMAPPAEESSKSSDSPPSEAEPLEKLKAVGDRTPAETLGSKQATPDRNAVRAFRWESGENGAIDWVEGAPRAALVGQSLSADPRLATKVGAREAFALETELAALPGRWHLEGQPEYDENSGRFLGYRGVATRGSRNEKRRRSASARPVFGLPEDPDSLRELVHEIKTPLNAIIGFAEIIDGQYLGPAHRRYRERAAEIVAQARILLEAIKDLDFAARMQGGREDAEAKPLAAILADLRSNLVSRAERGGSSLSIDAAGEAGRCATNATLAGRLIERLVHALLEITEPGEKLSIGTSCDVAKCSVHIALPRAIEALGEAKLFDPALLLDRESRSLLGIGFALRLVRGLARVGGGDLVLESSELHLSLVRAA